MNSNSEVNSTSRWTVPCTIHSHLFSLAGVDSDLLCQWNFVESFFSPQSTISQSFVAQFSLNLPNLWIKVSKVRVLRNKTLTSISISILLVVVDDLLQLPYPIYRQTQYLLIGARFISNNPRFSLQICQSLAIFTLPTCPTSLTSRCSNPLQPWQLL